MESIVGHRRVKGNKPKDLFIIIKQAMEDAGYKDRLKGGKSIFLKVSLISDNVVPGLCTSPWVVEGILKVIRPLYEKVFVGDSDLATTKQVEHAAQLWGIKDLCKKYGAIFVNMSKERLIRININKKYFRELEIPKILTQVNHKVTIPVLKTHYLTGLTCSLKNQWGCLPRYRHQFHPIANKVIPIINEVIGMDFAVTDATVCIEGNGPRLGTPKVVNSVFASKDLVALDSVGADYIGIGKENIGHIFNAEKIGLGSMNYSIKGDKIEPQNFVLAKIERQPIVRSEIALRKIPVLREVIFNTALFKIAGWIATMNNTVLWYHTKGKKHTQRIIKNHPLYRAEFLPLLIRKKHQKIKKY